MQDPIARLIEQLLPAPLNEGVVESKIEDLPAWLPDRYRQFLSSCNGGYFSDGYWHFFGLRGGPQHNVLAWNEPSVWKAVYGLPDELFAFAEDLFGNQYAFEPGENGVKIIWVIDGTCTPHASFKYFVQDLFDQMDDPEDGYWRTARRWIKERGEKPEPGDHLSYDVPPILGGSEGDLANLNLIEAHVNMSISGQIASQVRHLPPGTRIDQIRITTAPAPKPPALGRRPWWKAW